MISLDITNVGLRENVNGLFNEYLIEAFANVGPFIKIGQQFAYMGIIIIALKVLMNEKTRADIFEYVKWIPLCWILMHYKTFTFAIFEFYNNMGIALQSNDVNWDVILKKIDNAYSDNVGLVGSIPTYGLIFSPSSLEATIMYQLTAVLTYLAAGISTVVFIGMKAFSVIYLFVLIVFGPLNIGASFIPALSGWWKNWLQKFMSVCLWIPMLYLIDNFMVNVIDKIIDGLLQDPEANVGTVLIGALLILMNVSIYLKAPTLANFIVQGMSVSADSIKDKPKKYAKKAANAAMDAKTGGATKGLRTAMQ